MSTGWTEIQFPGMARTTDPDTSHTAAANVAPRAEGDRLLALQTLANWPAGLTDFELADKTGRQQTSIGKRRGELVNLGYVERATDEVGNNLRGLSPTFTTCAIWRITNTGRQALDTGTPLTLRKADQ